MEKNIILKKGGKKMKLDIYEVVEGTDNWEKIETIEKETEEECHEYAEYEYGSDGKYHWTNVY